MTVPMRGNLSFVIVGLHEKSILHPMFKTSKTSKRLNCITFLRGEPKIYQIYIEGQNEEAGFLHKTN